VGPDGIVRLDGHSPGDIDAIRQLAHGGLTYDALIARSLARSGLAGLRTLHECLGQLFARGWLAHQVCYRRRAIVSAIPATGDYALGRASAEHRACVLSRFALIRREGSQVLLESPTARAQVVLHDWRAMALLWRLSTLGKAFDAEAPQTGLPVGVVRSVIELLLGAGVLTTVNASEGVPEDETAPLVHWEFHDLLFHSRSRFGRHRSPFGATRSLEGRVAPPPAIKPRPAGTRISLFRPSIPRLMKVDWPLTRALEERRSQRAHAKAPITRRQIGELLYRTARVRSVEKGKRGEWVTSQRVYPSGGATYALELYLAVNTCERLAGGLYHYCPEHHELQRVARMNSDVRALLDDAGQAVGADAPQVLITIAARFLRASWKYSSISYALILKEVGVLLQTMYLVATAMELGICAIGAGNSDLFARASGTNYYDEGSVGELILGRSP
jgi:SagB-type dehydrogenase family enzyme